MSDRVGVMSQGRLQQVADPREIYNNPVNGFVASFVGEMNILTGQVGPSSGGFASFATPHGTFRARIRPGHSNAPVKLFIRPEHMTLTKETGGENAIPVTIGDVAFEGNFVTVTAQADTGAKLTAELRNDGSSTAPERDKRMFMRFDPAHAAILPDETQPREVS